MNNSILTGDIEAFPSQSDIFITFSDPDDESSYFETTVDRSDGPLASLLQSLEVSTDPSYTKPCKNYKRLAKQALERNIMTVFCPKDKVTQILAGIEADLTPEDEFPGEEKSFSDQVIDFHEYITLKEPCVIHEQLYEKGSTLKFSYKVKI